MLEINTAITRGIILAAGDGDRMGELTKDRPKVLIQMNQGEPLITFPIRALAAAGIKNVAIVVGYLAEEVRRNLEDGSQHGVNLSYVDNPDYLGGNAISAWKAKSWTAGEPVILCMGDHLIEKNAIRRLLSNKVITDSRRPITISRKLQRLLYLKTAAFDILARSLNDGMRWIPVFFCLRISFLQLLMNLPNCAVSTSRCQM